MAQSCVVSTPPSLKLPVTHAEELVLRLGMGEALFVLEIDSKINLFFMLAITLLSLVTMITMEVSEESSPSLLALSQVEPLYFVMSLATTSSMSVKVSFLLAV